MGAVEYIPRIRQQYTKLGYQAYAWVASLGPPPWQPLRKPLARSRLALVASGGIYVTGQVAFHYKDDTSLRAIPTNVKTRDLRITHFAYDKTDARADPNVVFPIDPLRALVEENSRKGGRRTRPVHGRDLFGPARAQQSSAANHQTPAGGESRLGAAGARLTGVPPVRRTDRA